MSPLIPSSSVKVPPLATFFIPIASSWEPILNAALPCCVRFTNRSPAALITRARAIIPNTTGAPIPPPIIVTSTKSAELIKHASNAFLATKISFINAVANICEAVGADIKEVCEGIGTDSRIGRRFLNPGIGYGGSCFPKDLKAFSSVARETGYEFRMLQEVMNINAEQRARFLRKVRSALWTLKGKTSRRAWTVLSKAVPTISANRRHWKS